MAEKIRRTRAKAARARPVSDPAPETAALSHSETIPQASDTPHSQIDGEILPPHLSAPPTEAEKPFIIEEKALSWEEPAAAPPPSSPPDEPAQTAPAPQKGVKTAFLPIAGAGLTGAVIALALGYGAIRQGLVPQAPDQALEARIHALEGRSTSPAPGVDLSPLNDRLDAVEQATKAMRPVSGDSNATLAKDLNTRMGETQQALEAARLARQSLEDRLKALESVDPALLQKKVGAALAIDSLRTAFERHAPFTEALKLANPFISDPKDVADLAPLAEKGLTPRPLLARNFEPVAKLMIAAQPRPEGFFARMGQSLGSIVTIRKKGEETGETPLALIGRIEAALMRGERRAALAVYETLPEPMRQAGAAWARDMDSEARAEAAMKALSAKTIQALGSQQ